MAVDANLVDQVWAAGRPARPREPIKVLDVQFAGKRFEEKLDDLRKELKKRKRAGFVVATLDEIAWLFNVRGSDIPYNPVFFSYAIVTATSAALYVDEAQVDEALRAHLAGSVDIRPYEAVADDLAALALSVSEAEAAGGEAAEGAEPTKFLTSTKTSWALSRRFGGEKKLDEARSPVGDAKAIKNDTELEGMRASHVRDGAALTEYFAWLEEQLVTKGARVDEVEGAEKLREIRARHDRFVGLSFDTISSTGANAAVIHYKPERGACAVIDPAAVYLCDSGAQYLDGTTDTTRTLHFGEPTAMERKAYTLVLKGHIALDRAVFPKGTTGFAIDALARQFLWEEGLDYRHGTGHGVGSYLVSVSKSGEARAVAADAGRQNVHEGPMGIGTRIGYAEVALAAGNVLSNGASLHEDRERS